MADVPEPYLKKLPKRRIFSRNVDEIESIQFVHLVNHNLTKAFNFISPLRLPSDPVTSPKTPRLDTNLSSREAERWGEDERSEKEHYLSASLTSRVEKGVPQIDLDIEHYAN
jgi:hypothetical protein